MKEPADWLPYSEQEEQRRTFWSAYLLDKLISCGRLRPLIILDEDCDVQLPCDELTFRHGESRKTNTLHQLQCWNTELTQRPSPFALTILMASIFGRSTRYAHHNRSPNDIPPWDTKSEFSAINSSLLLMESYSKPGGMEISDVIPREGHGEIDRQRAGHVIFAHTLFHLCHCLLNHPFLLHLRLKPFGAKVPDSFFSRAFEIGHDHARLLVDVLYDATEADCPVESSFYAYCVTVAGGIHSLCMHSGQSITTATLTPHESQYFQRSADMLDKLAQLWPHAANMVCFRRLLIITCSAKLTVPYHQAGRLRDFHIQSHLFSSLLDPSCLTDDLDPVSEDILWSMIDYAALGSDPHKQSISSGSVLSNMPSPNSWAAASNAIAPPPPALGSVDANAFGNMASNMQLDGMEYLLNSGSDGSSFI